MTLHEIDLAKADKHECPGIRANGTFYLCQIHGNLFAGTFNRQWYGLNFDGWYNGIQFDAPGSNASMWERVWEIRGWKRPKRKPVFVVKSDEEDDA